MHSTSERPSVIHISLHRCFSSAACGQMTKRDGVASNLTKASATLIFKSALSPLKGENASVSKSSRSQYNCSCGEQQKQRCRADALVHSEGKHCKEM